MSGSHRGFSSGRKWADDAPNEGGEEELSIAVMNMGACGAFVHGLEDEFMGKRCNVILYVLTYNETFLKLKFLSEYARLIGG